MKEEEPQLKGKERTTSSRVKTSMIYTVAIMRMKREREKKKTDDESCCEEGRFSFPIPGRDSMWLV